MKHLLLIVGALVLLAFAGLVVWSNRTALTTPILGFSGGCIAFAFLLAVPAESKEAWSTLAQAIPMLRRGGDR